MPALNWEIVYRVFVSTFFMLRLHCLKVCPPLFLCKCLSQNRLMSLIFLFLGIDVINFSALISFAEESLVLVLLRNLVILNFLKLALGTFLKLVSERDS